MVTLLPQKKRKKRIALTPAVVMGNIQIVISALLLFFIVAAYFGLVLYEKNLGNDLERLRDQVREIQDKRSVELEKEVFDFSSRLEKIDSLLGSHTHASKLFSFVEDITHPAVQLRKFTFTAEEGLVSMNGATRSYTTLAEQIIAFEQNQRLSDLSVSSISLLKTGEVTFSVSFSVEESVYK